MFSFIETRLFTRLVQDYLTDDQYRDLQALLIEEPDVGDVIPGSGGVRKLRWRAPGRGKRGGYRVIYYPKIEQGADLAANDVPKNVRDDIPADVLRKIRREIDNE